MTRVHFSACALLAALSLSSCTETTETSRERERASRFGYGSSRESTVYQETAPPSSVTTTETTTMTTPEPTPSTSTSVTTTTSVDKKDYQYGTPVPGKPGFVTSPHAPYSGYVDVRGFPPGTEVKDPYTGKIFLVP